MTRLELAKRLREAAHRADSIVDHGEFSWEVLDALVEAAYDSARVLEQRCETCRHATDEFWGERDGRDTYIDCRYWAEPIPDGDGELPREVPRLGYCWEWRAKEAKSA